jgi:HlyD family secretion protein
LKKISLFLLLPIGALVIWVFARKTELPRVPFAKATRQTISNTLSTNGKVEPIEYVDVRVQEPGLVKRVLVHSGDSVREGQVLAELSQTGLTQDLAAAEARAAQSRAELQSYTAGGRTSDVAELNASLSRLQASRDLAQRNLQSLERLQKQQAATSYEVQQAHQALNDIDVQIRGLEQRRGALVGHNDLAAAQARLREADANVALAKQRLAQNVITSPMAGVVYDLPAREGAYLNAGDAVASVGKLDPVRVRVYVDEPEVGHIAPGEPVRITWDALPGKEWHGSVQKLPTEIVALGSRQVGQVLCTIDNPGRELIPGTNVNAFILTQVVRDALTIPRNAIRHDNGVGVYVLMSNNTVRWENVRTGVSEALRVEIVSGLKQGDAVAEATDQPLSPGEKVDPVLE